MRNFSKAGLMVVAACLLAGNAWANRGHWHSHSGVRLGIHVGVPWVYPPYYPYPIYVPQVYAPAVPPVYIEQQPARTMEPGYWYYCNETQTYYPYVRECPGPWQKVVPQPPQ